MCSSDLARPKRLEICGSCVGSGKADHNAHPVRIHINAGRPIQDERRAGSRTSPQSNSSKDSSTCQGCGVVARLAGDHGDTVGGHASTGLIDTGPFQERPHELLMMTLTRLSRRAEALEVYDRMRRRLADELGIDPGPRLRELHERVLGSNPALVRRPPLPRHLGQIGRASCRERV